MPLLIEGDQVYKKSAAPLGPDERNILDALHGQGELGERLKADLEKQKNRAKYKIEVQFGKDRSMSMLKPSTAVIMAMESGRRFHGGGDQRMVFCGYWPGQGYKDAEACGKPVKDENFAVNHMVCPHCHREQFLDPQVKKRHIQIAKQERQNVDGLLKMPIANPMLIAKMNPKNLSVFVAKIFRDLDSNADVYMKYHPTDIRGYDAPEAKKPDIYEKAREDRVVRKENRGLVIYPLENIIRDTLSGATLEGRLQALFLA